MQVKGLGTKILSVLPKAGLALGTMLIVFLAYQHASLWIQNQKYSQVQVNRPKVERMALQVDEQEAVVPCVNVKAIVKKPSQHTTPHSSPFSPVPLEAIPYPDRGLESISLLPDYPLLLSRYLVKAPLSSDLVLESYLLADGSNEIVPAKTQPSIDIDYVELGKLRELGIWIGYEGSQTQGSEYTGRTPPIQWGYSLDISYQQDMFRLFGNWTRLSASVGFQEHQGARAKIAIAPLAFRF